MSLNMTGWTCLRALGLHWLTAYGKLIKHNVSRYMHRVKVTLQDPTLKDKMVVWASLDWTSNLLNRSLIRVQGLVNTKQCRAVLKKKVPHVKVTLSHQSWLFPFDVFQAAWLAAVCSVKWIKPNEGVIFFGIPRPIAEFPGVNAT